MTMTSKNIIASCLLALISCSAIAGKSQSECIKLAADMGYKDEHCAAYFISVCKTATKKSEIQSVLFYDKQDGSINMRMCGPKAKPNGIKYSADWKRIVGDTNAW
jgi:hypothetical protein